MDQRLCGEAVPVLHRHAAIPADGGNATTSSDRSLTSAADLFAQGRLDEAAAACRAALTRDHRDVPALHLLGLVLLGQESPAEAAALLADVAERHNTAVTLNDLAGALKATGLVEEAQDRLYEATQRDPAHGPAFHNLGILLLQRGQDEQALSVLRAAARLDPGFADTQKALASALLRAGNAAYAEYDTAMAEAFYREALTHQPDFVAALGNLGNALVLQVRMTEALACYAHALALDPGHSDIRFAYALALLLSGDFVAGWREYEARRSVVAMQRNYDRRPELPQWRPGMTLTGKRILLLAEQGAGDIVQYVRFVPQLTALAGVEPVLEIPDGLRPLFRQTTIGLDDPAPDGCDLALPLLSLPLVLGTTRETIPARVPYIDVADDRLARWDHWIGDRWIGDRWIGDPTGQRVVGLVCSGDARHPHDRLRSVPLTAFAPLLSLPGFQFVLVQNELRDADRIARETMPGLRFPGEALADFGDTAALLSQCDLIISVDTSAAHIAGALGLPAWLMLPYSPDHRWLLGRPDSPWYPTLRLYRQFSPGNWDAAIETIRRDLARL